MFCKQLHCIKLMSFLVNKNSVSKISTNTIYNTTIKKDWGPFFDIIKLFYKLVNGVGNKKIV